MDAREIARRKMRRNQGNALHGNTITNNAQRANYGLRNPAFAPWNLV